MYWLSFIVIASHVECRVCRSDVFSSQLPQPSSPPPTKPSPSPSHVCSRRHFVPPRNFFCRTKPGCLRSLASLVTNMFPMVYLAANAVQPVCRKGKTILPAAHTIALQLAPMFPSAPEHTDRTTLTLLLFHCRLMSDTCFPITTSLSVQST
ncbi:hypothetical protein M011DRAFT_223375 [Sporormia fimetaria CBS 119925]|uniref:Uncharacterized protein n=1 Tax=Sporormia fimetaria CBS 119925 TaxID=1340428 RepID=A0A6A6UYF2_9PLEO|nr:hypothetical protein M011DRAFT_223375 [Sporormia fimetaria CBS 119925]